MFRHPDGCYLLLAVNSHPYPVDAAYAVDAFRGGKVRRLFGVPDVKPTADGAFADRLEAYGTRAYEFDVQPAPGASGPIRVDVSLTAHSDAAQPETVFNTVDIAARRNVAVNPSAEIMNSPDVPDFLYPTHYRWPVPIGETGAIWNVVTDRPVHGRQCIRMDFPETSTPAPRGYNKQTGTQGKCFLPVLREPNPYVFSLYLRGGRTGDTAAVSVTGLKPGQGTFSLTPDWQRFSIQGTMASGGEKTFTISTSRGSTVWMDAIQMEAGAAPTPFTEE